MLVPCLTCACVERRHLRLSCAHSPELLWVEVEPHSDLLARMVGLALEALRKEWLV